MVAAGGIIADELLDFQLIRLDQTMARSDFRRELLSQREFRCRKRG